MRTLPPGLQARLDTGCITLATAWILRRTDGVVLGFTDHDADLVVDGVTCRAASGFDASAAAEKLGFAPAAAEVAGALVDDAIAEADLRAGRYDGATVEVHCVDWERPDLAVHLSTLTLGAVTREGKAFRAELRSRTSALDVERGRLYTPRCSADLGDARCGVDLTGPDLPAPGDAVTVSIGCDKSFATCRDRFANALNFRGFPHMPGIDRILSVPMPGEGGHDGSVVG